MSARKYNITGRVQGVGFRWFVMRRGKSLDLTGWVRNLSDGSVEVWAEGADDNLDLLESLLRDGPPGAMVREVQAEIMSSTGRYSGFDMTW